jgi:hypothetical protein
MDVLGRVGALVAQHVEVNTHRGAQGHVFEQLAIVGERVVDEHVVVVRLTVRKLVDQGGPGRDDEDFRQREGDALAQLVAVDHARVGRIRSAKRTEPPRFEHVVGGELFVQRVFDPVAVVHSARGRGVELLAEPDLIAGSLQMAYVGIGRSERCLCKKTRRFGRARRNRERRR